MINLTSILNQHVSLAKRCVYFAILVFSFSVQANPRVYSVDKLKKIESFAQSVAAGKLKLKEVTLTQDAFASTGLVRESRVGATGDNIIDKALNQIANYFVAPFLTSQGVSLLTASGAVVDPGMKMTVDGMQAQFIRAQAKDYVFVIDGKEYTIKYKKEES